MSQGCKRNMKTWFNIENKKGKKAIIRIYKPIGDFGITALDFINEFEKITANEVDIHVNGPGGDVFEAWAIHNYLKDSDKIIDTYIDAVAASALSYIVCVGRKVYMAKSARYMIHRASCMTFGNVNQHKLRMDLLQGIDEDNAEIYHGKTGIAIDKIMDMLDAETWMKAKEAKEKGFIDEIIGDSKNTKNISNFDFKVFNFKHIPEDFLIKPENKKNKEEDQMEELLKQLGVKTESEAVAKIRTLQLAADKVPGLELSINDLTGKIKIIEEKEIKDYIDSLISGGKLTEEQRSWAIELATTNKALFDTFIEKADVIDLGKTKDLDPGEGIDPNDVYEPETREEG